MKKRTSILLFCFLLATYIALAAFLPSDPQVLKKYDMTQTEAKLLSMSIVIPISIIYLTALYAYIRVRSYSKKVSKTKEGPHLKNISKGIFTLVFTLPIISIISSLTSYTKFRYPDLLNTATVFKGYLVLILSLIAFLYIAKGTQGLYGTLKNQDSIANSRFAVLLPIILAGFFAWFVTGQSTGNANNEGFRLPDWLIVLTIVIPYVFIWSEGLKAAFHLYKYQKEVKGVVYKKAFRYLSFGLGMVVAIAIATQMITAFSGQLSRLDLTPLLGIVYVLILMYAVAYGLIARGAKKLRQIEEV